MLFVSGITGLSGMSLISEISLSKTVLVFVACFLSYGFGQALTDCFQVDTDSLSAPYRPLTQCLISKNQVLTISILGLIFCVSIFAIYNPMNLILGVIAGIGLATYTPFKRRWWAGPFYNAWIMVVLCVMAFFTGVEDVLFVFSTSFMLIFFTVSFGYANFVLTGYFKDIDADRRTGYKTLPVVFGRRIAALTSDGFALLAIVSVVLFFIQVLRTPPITYTLGVTLIFGVAGIVAAVVAQLRLHQVSTDEDAHSAIAPVVHSYILVLSSITCFQKPEWVAFLIFFYAGFVLVLKARPARNQI